MTSAEAITSVTISARFSPQDAALIRAIAKKQRINYSEVLRQGVIALANVYAPHDTTVRLHTAPSPQQRSHGHNATVRLQGQERPSGTDAPHAKILATT